MTDINEVILIGHITRDLEERNWGYVSNSLARANISIAVKRSRKNGDEWVDDVNYFDVTIWGKTAENLKPYLKKGKQICVEGYLKQDRWEKDGQKFSKVSVVANSVQLLGGRGDSPYNAGEQNTGMPRLQPASGSSMNSSYSNSYSSPQDSYGDIGSGIDEDIPF